MPPIKFTPNSAGTITDLCEQAVGEITHMALPSIHSDAHLYNFADLPLVGDLGRAGNDSGTGARPTRRNFGENGIQSD